MMSKDIAKDVKVSPETLTMKPNEPVTVTVKNTGKRALTYKLKTTRPAAVKPNKAFGVIKSAKTDVFKVNYKPNPREKPFADSDRVTVLVQVMPDSFAKPEDYWKTPNAAPDAHRVTLKLVAGEAGKAAESKKEEKPKKEKGKKEEDVKSEESEAETESGTESGSEATESDA